MVPSRSRVDCVESVDISDPWFVEVGPVALETGAVQEQVQNSRAQSAAAPKQPPFVSALTTTHAPSRLARPTLAALVDNDMTTKDATAKDPAPTLDEWMAQIREKKLRKVVTNEHKSKELLVEKGDRPIGPHGATEITKMRQGLRSVSTPKWPGANDAKAKTNTTVLPQRAQLRAVSERTNSSPGVFTSEQKVTKTGDAKSEDLRPPSGSHRAIPDDWVTVDKLDVPETPVPVNGASASEVDVLEHDSADGSPDSSSESEPRKQPTEPENHLVELVEGVSLDEQADIRALPGSEPEIQELKSDSTGETEDDFPLDLEKTSTTEVDASEDLNEPSTPVTLSTGTFDTSAETTKLSLPEAGANDFPLDLEQSKGVPETTSEVEKSDSLEVAPVVNLSSGITDNTQGLVLLESPPKPRLKTAAAEAQTEALTDSHRAALEPEAEDNTDIPASAEGAAEPATTTSVAEISSVLPPQEPHQEVKLTLTENVDGETSTVESTEGMPHIKCSQCSADLPLAALETHDCLRITEKDF